MPVKKTSKTKSSKTKSSNNLDFQKLIQSSDSYKSLIYGILTVLVLFVVIVMGVRTLSMSKTGEIEENAAVTSQNNMSTYTVSEGDTLWSIAEKEYGDGFRWNEIAKANRINEASTLEEGTKLSIPNKLGEKVAATNTSVSPTVMVEPTSAPEPTNVMVSPAVTKVAPTMAMAPGQTKISGTDYKIIEGDTLWDIAVRAYGDGYRWGEIAKANALPNPDLIYTGNSLKLPRP